MRTAVSILVVKSYEELLFLSKSLIHLDCFGEFLSEFRFKCVISRFLCGDVTLSPFYTKKSIKHENIRYPKYTK